LFGAINLTKAIKYDRLLLKTLLKNMPLKYFVAAAKNLGFCQQKQLKLIGSVLKDFAIWQEEQLKW
jgi:hypothetical protein